MIRHLIYFNLATGQQGFHLRGWGPSPKEKGKRKKRKKKKKKRKKKKKKKEGNYEKRQITTCNVLFFPIVQ